MQGRRVCKKLLMILVCVLIAGCSKQPSAEQPSAAKQPLNSMTMGEVRQLVEEWKMFKLPEQQVEVAAGELRKEFSSVKTFYKVFGEPKERSLIGDSYYFQYRCKDGIVIIDINAYMYDRDRVIINGVSVL